MTAEINPRVCLSEIRMAMGIVALLHEGEQLDSASVRRAVTVIDQELVTLERLLAGYLQPASATLPVMTLAEVSARQSERRRLVNAGQPTVTGLRLIDGGRA